MDTLGPFRLLERIGDVETRERERETSLCRDDDLGEERNFAILPFFVDRPLDWGTVVALNGRRVWKHLSVRQEDPFEGTRTS